MTLGREAKQVAEEAQRWGACTVRLTDYLRRQMLDSVRPGLLRAAQSNPEAVLVLPCDVPLVQAATVCKLLAALSEEVMAVRPAYRGQGGHPLLLDARLIPLIAGYEGPMGLRGFLASLGSCFQTIPVDAPAVALDADTPADYQKLRRFACGLESKGCRPRA